MKCHGRPLALVLLLFVFSGCADHHSWNSFPVDLYSDPALVSDDASMGDFGAAMSFWEAKAGHRLFNYKGNWTGQMPPFTGNPQSPDSIMANVIFAMKPWPFAANVAGQTTVKSSGSDITGAMIMINPNLGFCSGTCTAEPDMTSRQKAFAHELGHFLGLEHVSDTANIMYPTILTNGPLSAMQIDTDTFHDLTDK